MIHANIQEVLQTLVAGWGVMINFWALTRAYADVRWLRDNGYNGPRCFWAMSRIRQEWMLLFMQSCFLAMGFASLYLPPPLTAEEIGELPVAFVDTLVHGSPLVQRLLLQGDLKTATLIVATVVAAIFSMLNSGDRNVLVHHDWATSSEEGTS